MLGVNHQAELSLHDAFRGALTCADVWELTAYTNGCVANTNHFSGELHRPISPAASPTVSHLLPHYPPISRDHAIPCTA